MTIDQSHKNISRHPKRDDQQQLITSYITDLENRDVSVGRRLREIRLLRRLSLRALAELSGLNINTVSLIENEHTSPSVSTLQQLAHSLQVSVTEFFQTDHGSKELVHQKHSLRPRVAFNHSTIEDLASGMPRFGMEPIIVTLEPNANSGKKAIVHTGREFVYCLEGHVAYTVDSENYLLESGDSLIFEAYLPHQWKNVDSALSRVLLVMCPMDERDQPCERHFSDQV